MNQKRFLNKPAFTLIELLAVIAIITLLMGILVPAVGNARDQAKKTKTQALLSAVSKGIETFKTEHGESPESTGENPFETTGGSAYLTGAQWLALYMTGADGRGWVKPELMNDSDSNGKIDNKDWLDWYGLTPRRNYQRAGLYVPTDGKILQSPEVWAQNNSSAAPIPASLQKGSSVWKNSKVPFFVDAFGFPVLYYTAATFEQNRMVWNGGDAKKNLGRYDPSDNAAFTGMDGNYGRNPKAEDGWDLTGAGRPHSMKVLGFVDETTLPAPDTFSRAILNMSMFEQTKQGNKGRVWPRNPDSFILVTPGKDGIYGTTDDVRNFESN